MSIAALTNLPVRDACEAWLESRRFHIAPRTFYDYQHYIKTFSPDFTGLLITDVDGDTLRAYQQKRRKQVGPGLINKELGVIIQVRKRIQKPITDYQPLQMPKDYETPGRALSASEEEIWAATCRAAADHKSWATAALVSLLSLRTGCGPGEILSLKLQDIAVDGPEPMIEVPRRGAKRVRRERAVGLLGEGLWAARKLIKLANQRGSVEPGHFLIPARNRDNSWDPTRPAKGFRESFEKLKDAARIKFRFYDHRHTAVSKGLRNPKASVQMNVDHFGWISPKMIQKYYHGNSDNRRVMAAALDAQEQQKKPVQKDRRTSQKAMKTHA